MTYQAEQELKVKVLKRLAPCDDPLIAALVYWINGDDLWAACEHVGMVKAAHGTLVMPQELTAEILAVLEEHLHA